MFLFFFTVTKEQLLFQKRIVASMEHSLFLNETKRLPNDLKRVSTNFIKEYLLLVKGQIMEINQHFIAYFLNFYHYLNCYILNI